MTRITRFCICSNLTSGLFDKKLLDSFIELITTIIESRRIRKDDDFDDIK